MILIGAVKGPFTDHHVGRQARECSGCCMECGIQHPQDNQTLHNWLCMICGVNAKKSPRPERHGAVNGLGFREGYTFSRLEHIESLVVIPFCIFDRGPNIEKLEGKKITRILEQEKT